MGFCFVCVSSSCTNVIIESERASGMFESCGATELASKAVVAKETKVDKQKEKKKSERSFLQKWRDFFGIFSFFFMLISLSYKPKNIQKRSVRYSHEEDSSMLCCVCVWLGGWFRWRNRGFQKTRVFESLSTQ